MKAGDKTYAGWRRLGRPRYAGTLTPRQQDVFDLLVTGLTNEEIAQHLGITPYGVKYHVAEILLRLGAENRHDAVALHLRTGGSGRLAAWAPFMFLRKLPFAWLSKAAAGGALTLTGAGIALLAWGVMTTSTATVTTTGCSVEQMPGGAPCAAGVAQAATGDAGGGAISAISAGFRHTCALKDGGAWCWGGYYIGDGVTAGNPVPMAVPRLTSGVSAISSGIVSCAVKDGGVWCWGGLGYYSYGSNDVTERNPVPVAVPGLASGVSAISAGYTRPCAVKDSGVWCWDFGGGSGGAVPGLASGVSTISAASGIACALKDDGGVWCWGDNWAGQLGNDSTTDSDVPVAVSGLGSGVSAISAGRDHVCAIKEGGVWCWGWNGDGQLGNGTTAQSHVPVAVPGLESGVSAISAGWSRTCAVKDGGAWCWGSNDNGQLGNNSTTDSRLPVAVSGLASGVSTINAGDGHFCALKDGAVWCWGWNDSGQLGSAGPGWSEVPVAVSGLASGVTDIEGTCALKGGGVWCWGETGGMDSPVPVPVLGLADGVSALIPGSCAQKDDDLRCWGWFDDRDFQIRASGWVGDVGAISENCAVKDGGVWCMDENRGAVPYAVSGLESGVSAISVPCALKDGGVWCWVFDQDKGGLATDPVPVPGLERGVSAIIGSCALQDGGVWCWGWDQDRWDDDPGGLATDPVPVPGMESGASAISAGYFGVCALKDSGVWCWRGGTVTAPRPGLESGVSAISGDCALKEGGVWCWGPNSLGQLGDNSPTEDYSLVPVAVEFPPASAGDIAVRPAPKPLSSQPSTDSADHRTAYVLGGAAAAALAIVAAGVWAIRRRRIT